jgi:hypothetical protein
MKYFRIREGTGIEQVLADEEITPGDGAYSAAEVTEVLKALFADQQVLRQPRRGGERVTAGVSRPQDSDGYRVLVQAPGQDFWLASKLVFAGNANGVAYRDFPELIEDAVRIANAMLRAWDRHGAQ